MRYEEIKQAYIGMRPHVLNVGNYSIAGQDGDWVVYVYWQMPGAFAQVAQFPLLEAAISFARENSK